MTLIFYPHADDVRKGNLEERIELLLEAAERFKAVVLEIHIKQPEVKSTKKETTPRDQTVAFNWEEIARVLREIKDLPEMNKQTRIRKSDLLAQLAEIYEVLRGARMSKLEAVRLALIGEATQLRAGSRED